MLSSDINTIFRGRGIEIKVLPLSFSEFMLFKGGLDKYDAFDEFVRFGGLPYVTAEESPSGKTAYLNMLSNTVVRRVAISHEGKRFYIQVSFTIEEESTKERELSAFRKLDDGYKKILITMDRNPLTNLENGYQMIHLFDFLLNENALEEI